MGIGGVSHFSYEFSPKTHIFQGSFRLIPHFSSELWFGERRVREQSFPHIGKMFPILPGCITADIGYDSRFAERKGPSFHASRIMGALLTMGGLQVSDTLRQRLTVAPGLGGMLTALPVRLYGSLVREHTHTARLPDAPPFLRGGDRHFGCATSRAS